MADHVVKLPDIGEGVAEAELVEWYVEVGALVEEDAALAAVMTDKATVEIPSPVRGKISWTGANVGELVAVGAPLVRIATDFDAAAPAQLDPTAEEDDDRVPPASSNAVEDVDSLQEGASEKRSLDSNETGAPAIAHPPQAKRTDARPKPVKPLASPAVRHRAKELGVDLRQVSATGPAGRITHEDLDAFLQVDPNPAFPKQGVRRAASEVVRISGLRRRIAERMTLANREIPHITYVEEIDMSGLEALRRGLNERFADERPRLTLLPFLVKAMAKALADQPQFNAHFDRDAGTITRFGAVHVGIATQTANGLMVPVLRDCETLSLWACADEIGRLANAARDGTAKREELAGSTITVTSLGSLGGVMTTPIINHPEVAILGVNKLTVRPQWDGQQFQPRTMMNLSSSFDHRVIDGQECAIFIQRIKALLETPATMFIDEA